MGKTLHQPSCFNEKKIAAHEPSHGSKGGEKRSVLFVSDKQVPVVLQPGDGAFNYPTIAVARRRR